MDPKKSGVDIALNKCVNFAIDTKSALVFIG